MQLLTALSCSLATLKFLEMVVAVTCQSHNSMIMLNYSCINMYGHNDMACCTEQAALKM